MANITDYEYKEIIFFNNYWCELYDIDEINSDLFFSKSLFQFITAKLSNKIEDYYAKKNVVDEKDKKRLLNSYIKNICRNTIYDSFKRKQQKFDNCVIRYNSLLEENELNKERLTDNVTPFEKLVSKNIKNKLKIIYDALSDKEQMLFELLSDGIKTKSILKELDMNQSEYNKYIDKLKRIVVKIFDIKNDDIKSLLSKIIKE